MWKSAAIVGLLLVLFCPEGDTAEPKNAQEYLDRGTEQYEKGHLDGALRDIDQAIRLNPKLAPAFKKRGDFWHVKKQEYDRALRDYNEAIRLDPKFARVFNNRALVWRKKKEDDKAIRDFDEAIRLDPKLAVFYSNRGSFWRDKSQPDKALRDLDEAIRLDPTLAEAFRVRAYVWEDKKENLKAIEDFTEAIRLNPKDAYAFAGRGNMWLGGTNEQAIKDSTEAIRLDPKLAFAYLVRGLAGTNPALRLEMIAKENAVSFSDLLVYAEFKSEQPLEDLDEAIRLDPTLSHAYLYRGILRSFNGKTPDAAQDFLECVRLDPNVPEAHVRLGKLYETQDKFYEALASYTEAVKQNPKDKESAASTERIMQRVRETWAKPEIKVLSIDLDPELKQVVVKKSPVIQLAPDTEKVVDDTIRVRHSTSFTSGWKAELEVRGKVKAWFVEVEAALRGGIEESTSRMFGTETETKRSVTIKGVKSGAGVRVVWVDYYRTGKAKVELDGKELELPFEFKEDFDLLTETVATLPSR